MLGYKRAMEGGGSKVGRTRRVTFWCPRKRVAQSAIDDVRLPTPAFDLVSLFDS